MLMDSRCILNNCYKFGISFNEYLKIIESYYKDKEYGALTSLYSRFEEECTPVDVQFMQYNIEESPVYGPSINAIQREYNIFLRSTKKRNPWLLDRECLSKRIYSQNIKHKRLNDANLIFNQN